MIRAALTGTNWTGKSTTINTFCTRHLEIDISKFELSTLVKQCPYPVIQEQTMESTEWIVGRLGNQLAQPVDAKIQLFDRSPIDVLAFNSYIITRDQIAPNKKLTENILLLTQQFDVLFLTQPGKDWPVDVNPTPDPNKIAFAKLMNLYILKIIETHSIPVVDLPWDLNERQNILDKYLQLN